jgi:hypothetical protein
MNTTTDTAQEFLQLVEDSLVQAKKAYSELQKERTERIRLEKIASDAQAATKCIVDDVVNILLDKNFIEDTEFEKYASILLDQPDKVKTAVNQLMKFSIPSSEEGRGIPKQASYGDRSEVSDESDAWQRVLEEGA